MEDVLRGRFVHTCKTAWHPDAQIQGRPLQCSLHPLHFFLEVSCSPSIRRFHSSIELCKCQPPPKSITFKLLPIVAVMIRPSTDYHSTHDEIRPAKTRQRASNVAVTHPSAITVNDNEMHAGIEPRIRRHDSGPDLDQLPRTKPKATAYLNSRVGELSRREISEPNPLERFKNPRNHHDIIAMAQLIFQKTKSPARFVEEVFRSIFVPEMRKFFTQKIQKLFRKHARTTVLSASQQKELDNGYLRLQEWETSSQISSGLFSLKSV